MYNYVYPSDVCTEDYKIPSTINNIEPSTEKTDSQNLVIDNINKENINVKINQEQVHEVSKEVTKNSESFTEPQHDENHGININLLR